MFHSHLTNSYKLNDFVSFFPWVKRKGEERNRWDFSVPCSKAAAHLCSITLLASHVSRPNVNRSIGPMCSWLSGGRCTYFQQNLTQHKTRAGLSTAENHKQAWSAIDLTSKLKKTGWSGGVSMKRRVRNVTERVSGPPCWETTGSLLGDLQAFSQPTVTLLLESLCTHRYFLISVEQSVCRYPWKASSKHWPLLPVL